MTVWRLFGHPNTKHHGGSSQNYMMTPGFLRVYKGFLPPICGQIRGVLYAHYHIPPISS